MEALATADGIEALYASLAAAHDQVVVMCGQRDRLLRILPAITGAPTDGPGASRSRTESVTGAVANAQPKAGVDAGGEAATTTLVQARALAYVTQVIADALGIPVRRIDADAAFDEYGIDSIRILEITNELEKSFGSLSKTLFFEYPTLRELTGYFLKAHREAVIALASPSDSTQSATATESPPNEAPATQARATTPARVLMRRFGRRADVGGDAPPSASASPAVPDIAIVGMSGRYPEAPDLESFWENLKAGRDCITEIPASRWDHALYFDERKGTPGKAYTKWGGFIDGVDEFDPLFFNISPNEARSMDPQERLFLETVWDLLEGSGHTKSSLQRRYNGRVGVYVGCMYHQGPSLSSHGSIANRVSYFFGLEGPSFAIDTMCSSGAFAIHSACRDLQHGDCDLAIAGGVNVTIDPKKYVDLCRVGLLGSDRGSRSFSDGDGHLPAEGVGAVLLKRLDRAIADGDDILAVIKATAVNHGGRSNGYAVPNPNAQERLMREVLRAANTSPESISCVEAAANGSALGDPIELAGLKRVFGLAAERERTCAIGSVKTNIGHAEAASALSQLAKVVLQLRHRQLVPSLVLTSLNPSVSFDGTPFHLQSELREWSVPDTDAEPHPRRALINSFGAGGANASLVVEEYVRPAVDQESQEETPAPELVVLSAKTPEALSRGASRLQRFVQSRPSLRLRDVAFTLQSREEMACRLALLVRTRAELVEGLENFLQETTGRSVAVASGPQWFAEDLRERSPMLAMFEGAAGEVLCRALVEEGDLEKVALFWTHGGKAPWHLLRATSDRTRVPLPTYSFEREAFRPDIVAAPPGAGPFAAAATDAAGDAARVGLDASERDQAADVQAALEEAVAGIWRDVLGSAGSTGQESFLELGGNSMSGAEIIRATQRRFGVELPIDTLLGDKATVENFAMAIIDVLATDEAIDPSSETDGSSQPQTNAIREMVLEEAASS
jgi:3-oxoacyl-(acyl-carrier-protein) synthase/acyl carrier protein